MSMLERAEAAERAVAEELDRTIVKSVIYVSGDRDPRVPITRPDNGKLVMMDQDPRLPRMPERPTLFDFFKYRFARGIRSWRARCSRPKAARPAKSSSPSATPSGATTSTRAITRGT